MRALIPALPALLLAGCATVPAPAGAPWIAGLWLGIDEGVEFPRDCAGDYAIRYTDDGRYLLPGEAGDWRLERDRLTETARTIEEPDEGTPEIGRAYVSRIAREDSDAFLKTYADGGQMRFRRCPARP